MTPETFEKELHARVGRNYRLRRALTNDRWCIEQKVDVVHDYPGSDDRQVRLRDGYHLVLDCNDHCAVECPNCFRLVELPVFEKAEFWCPMCEVAGYRVRFVDGYFPLVDKTLLYLERTHPRRGRAWADEIEADNHRHAKAGRRDMHNVAEDLALDAWNRISGVCQVGYTKVGTPHAFGSD